MKNHNPIFCVQVSAFLSLVSLAALPMAHANVPASAVSVRSGGTNAEGQQTFVLEWDAVSNLTYRVQQRQDFGTNSGWSTFDLLTPANNRASFSVVPVPAGTNVIDHGFFRLEVPSAEIFTIEPALVTTNGGVVTVIGQCLGTNASLRVGNLVLAPSSMIPGSSYTFSIAAGALAEGFYDVEIFDGTNLLAKKYKLFSVTGQPTPVGEAPQRLFEPPAEPPASPSLMKAKEKANRTKCSNNLRLIPSTGEVQVQDEDLHLPGLGLDFTWTRTYLSRNGRNTRMGQGWSHCYDISILQTNGGLAVFDGTGRSDVYLPDTNGVYTCDEIFNVGTFSNDVFTLEFPDGSAWVFNPISSGFASIARSQDRMGHALRFTYANSRLTEVIDTVGRTNRIAYDAGGRIQSVTDFSGRSVTYSYWRNGEAGGGNGDLRSVTSPRVTGTPHTNDFPAGKTTVYTYSTSAAAPELNHNLLSITDASGQTWLSLSYKTNESPSSVGFDRAHSMQRGEHPPTHLHYSRQSPSSSNGWAVLSTVVNDPEGNVTIGWFNSRNQGVIHRDLAARALPGMLVTETNLPTSKPYSDDPDFWETRYEWNVDSLCTRVIFPGGNSTEFVYQRTLDHNSSRSNKTSRRSDGNPRVIRERAAPGGDLDGDGVPDVVAADLVWRMDFDPRFGSPAYACSAGEIYGGPRQSTSLDGSRLSSEASRIQQKGWDGTIKGTARKLNRKAEELYSPWTLDENEGTVVNPLYEQSGMQGSNPLYEGSHFVVTGVDPRGSIDTAAYDAQGNVTVLHHRGRLLDGNDAPITHLEYHPNGQLAAIVSPPDAEGRRRRTELTYHFQNGDTPTLRTFTVDAAGPTISITRYEQDERGNITAVIDPRQNTNRFVYNQLDQVVARQTPDTSFGSRITTFYSYDANDNLTQVDVENRSESGALNPTNAFITTTYVFDELRRPTLLAHELTHVVQQRSATNRYQYDGVDNVIAHESPEAVNGNQPAATTVYEYDARQLLRARVLAPGTADASYDRFSYDPNGRLSMRSLGGGGGGSGGSVLVYARDGFGRCSSITDGMGNVRSFGYDDNHNVVYTRFDGETNDVLGPVGNRRLEETHIRYDSLDRVIERHVEFFDPVTQSPLLDGASSTWFAYAPNGACRSLKDDRGNTTTYEYDSAGRLTSVTDPKQNRTSYQRDSNGNVLAATQSERADLGGTTQAFTRSYGYDELNRCVLEHDNVGNTNRFGYDSRGNLTRHTDAQGNDTVRVYDGLNRCVTTIACAGASSAGITINTSHVEYDDNSRITRTRDDNGNTTRYQYDALGRCVSVTRADGTSESLVWSPRSNIDQRTDANGTVITFAYDELDRCVRKSIAPGPGVSPATTFEEFHYDGLSRLVLATNDASMLELTYDSLGNIVKAKQDCVAMYAQFDGVGNRTTVEYPSGRLVAYWHDSLNRITNVATTRAAGVPLMNLMAFAYEGSRLSRISRGNGINTRLTVSGDPKVPNAAGDFGWKQVREINHQRGGGGTVIDRRAFAYDALQNKTSRAQLAPFAAGQTTLSNSWAYDPLSRLHTSVRTKGTDVSVSDYTLDGVGNRLSTTIDGAVGLYTRDATTPSPADFQMDQYTTTPFGSCVYDRNGNLIAIPNAVGSTEFSYDYANRLITVSRTAGPAQVPVVKFTYDAAGRCIGKTEFPAGLPAVQTVYYYDTDDDCDDIIEETENGTLKKTYVIPHVLEVSGSIGFSAADSPVYTICDELGTALALTDDAGQVLERYEYGDYGQPRFLNADGIEITDPKTGAPVTSSPAGNRYLFRNMEWEPAIALYRVGPVKWMPPEATGRWKTDPYAEDVMRFYDPSTGRYVSGNYMNSPQSQKRSAASTFAQNNPWSGGGSSVMFNPREYSIAKMEGGRHTPFHNKYKSSLGAGPSAVSQGVITAREAGSGIATGRRTHVMPHVLETSGRMAREAGSGIATGRRTHVIPHVLETSGRMMREAGSGMATGRRTHIMPHVFDTKEPRRTTREAGSGMATGRRSGSIIILDNDGETEVARYNFFEAWPCRWKAPELNSHSDTHWVRGHVTILK